MKPLNGSSYINIFSHYRPVGDPLWFQKSNPPGTPEPLVDIGNCVRDSSHCLNGASCREKVKCSKVDLATLSPSMEVLHSGEDLLRYWKQFGHKTPPHIDIKDINVGAKVDGATGLGSAHSEL